VSYGQGFFKESAENVSEDKGRSRTQGGAKVHSELGLSRKKEKRHDGGLSGGRDLQNMHYRVFRF